LGKSVLLQEGGYYFSLARNRLEIWFHVQSKVCTVCIDGRPVVDTTEGEALYVPGWWEEILDLLDREGMEQFLRSQEQAERAATEELRHKLWMTEADHFRLETEPAKGGSDARS
jgi:hypothetical protein